MDTREAHLVLTDGRAVLAKEEARGSLAEGGQALDREVLVVDIGLGDDLFGLKSMMAMGMGMVMMAVMARASAGHAMTDVDHRTLRTTGRTHGLPSSVR